MKKRLARGLSTLLLLCAVLSAYALRERGQRAYTALPVTRIMAVVPAPTASPTPCQSYRLRREEQRRMAFEALSARIQAGDREAAEAFSLLLARAESELAVESALAGMGYPDAVCAVTEQSVSLCAGAPLSAAQAKTLIALCEKLTGKSAENVFILDESGYI